LSCHLLSRNVKVKIYKTIILPAVLYVCETWSLTIREEYTLWVFENRVLRIISGPERDEVTVEWRMESEWILGRLAWGVWIGFDWLRIGTGGGLL
jgi:hypothetical protein